MPDNIYMDRGDFNVEDAFDMIEEDEFYAVDGCGPIEADGHCEHGSPSLVLAAGLI